MLSGLDAIESSPITGVHLWFDRRVCPYEHVVTVGRLVQWVFDHTAIQGRTAENKEGQYLQVVISASYDLLGLDKHAIRDAVLADLAEIWPEVKASRSRAGGSSPNTVPPSPCARASIPSDHPSVRPSRDCSWRATGPQQAGRPPWKAPFGAATWPPKESSKTSASRKC